MKIKTQGIFTSKDDLFEIAKQHIKAGFPVIYTGSGINNTDSNPDNQDNKKSGHVMLLYELIQDEQDIVLSRCWNGRETQTFYNNDYDFDPTIIYLDIKNLQHTCSDNYFTQRQNGEGFCVCEIFSNHPNHTHNYRGKAYDDSNHWNRCLCGDKSQIEPHNLKKLYPTKEGTLYKCHDGNCDYQYLMPHTFVFDSLDINGDHIYYCSECGYKRVFEAHALTGCDRLLDATNSLSFHRITCRCGYYELEMHQFQSSPNPRYSYCTKCGYIKDNLDIGGGSAVIKGKKEDEETE